MIVGTGVTRQACTRAAGKASCCHPASGSGRTSGPWKPTRSSRTPRAGATPWTSPGTHHKAPRKYGPDITSVGQRSSPWPCKLGQARYKILA